MLDLVGIDVEEIATALADQTDYEHRWLIDPQTGEVSFWTSDTGKPTLEDSRFKVDPEDVTSERGRFVLEQSRVFDAPIARVFGMLTEPTELARWWGPLGFTTPEVQIDLRVGGSYRFTMQPPEGEPFHLSGAFHEVQAPSSLRFTFRWDEPVPDDRETVVELSLSPLGARTMVTLTQGEFATEERLQLHRSGWADSFGKLAAVLKSGAA